MRDMEMLFELFVETMAVNLRTLILKPFVMIWVSRSSDGIFLGYASHSRAFRVLNLDTNLVMETCKVTFNETQPCNSSIF
jgi:hypothetical protein